MSTLSIVRLYAAVSLVDRLLDRLSETPGIAKLSAVSLALFGLATAVAIATFSGRYADAASFAYAFDLIKPPLWAALYGIVSGLVLVAALLDRTFTPGALLGLSAVHTLLGVMTIPAFLFDNGLPTAFLTYAGYSVWCLITYLMWRLRLRDRP